MGFVGYIGHLFFIFSLSFIWTLYALIQAAIEFVQNPRGFLTVKSRPTMPEILTKGWKHGFVTLSEVKLHFVEDGSADKPLMLMLHGFPEFWYSWRHQLRAFRKDYRVVAIDMRGYGQSDKPEGIENYAVSKVVNDIREAVSALGHKSCILVAHDWGGAIAWRFALQYPEMVNRLIVCNCPHPKAFAQYLKGGSLKQMCKSWYMFFFQCPYIPEFILPRNDFKFFDTVFADPKSGGCRNKDAITKDDLDAWKYTYSQPGALTGPINYYRAAMRRVDNEHVRHKSFDVLMPTLLIWGTADLALEKGMALLSMKYCKNGVLKLVDGASHWVQQDEPELCNEYMKQFLS